MKKLILGVDGGGSKSHLAMFDENGECACVSACGALNHESLEGSFGELETVLAGFLRDALKQAGACAGDVAYAVFGMAGADTAAQHETISGILRRAGLRHFSLYNDAFLGVAAGCPDGVGVCAINGTGTSMAAVDHSGGALQIAGLGDLTDDRGGGGWYGRQVLGAVYNSLYKGGKATSMRDMLFARLGVARKEAYLETLTAAFANGEIGYGAAGRYVFAAAEAGDGVAVGILKQSARHFAGGIAYMASEMDFPADRTLYVTYAGSVFVKEKVRALPRLIEERVRARLGDRPVEFRMLDTVPVAGAVLWASQKAGFGVGMAAIKRSLADAGI